MQQRDLRVVLACSAVLGLGVSFVLPFMSLFGTREVRAHAHKDEPDRIATTRDQLSGKFRGAGLTGTSALFMMTIIGQPGRHASKLQPRLPPQKRSRRSAAFPIPID